MKKSLIILSILAPLALSRTPYNFFNTELGSDHVKEIYELKALTEKLSKLKQPYKNPLESSLTLSKEDVSFYVYNREDKTGDHVLLEQAGNITLYSSFRTYLKTVFVVHGWHNDYLSPIDVLVEAALLGFEDVNILAVCWDDLAQSSYSVAYAAVPLIGKKTGEFITALSASYDYPLDNIIIVGHSLGAHVAGFAGKETSGNLSAIVGLDPAGPLYLQLFEDLRLCQTDAKYVIAIHTCAKLLGVNYQLGDADFWANGGYSQAGCGLDVIGTCSHSRSYRYFVESATSDDFVARQCDTYDNYKDGKCKQNVKAVMGGPDVNTTILGNFFLNTNEQSPYAMGDIDF